ncbi:MAG: SDR family oxidoreductase [Proteobacteria bacterium]|nr:SDR family oxidoreductase [Pseudomonadota bacterium]
MEGTAARFDLTGRVALVTGSSRGIGRALALGLAQAGADCAIHDETGSDAAASVAREIAATGRRAEIFGADLADPAAPGDLIDRVAAAFGRLDILVLNASSETRRDWDSAPGAAFEREVSVNLRATIELAARAHPGMARRGWGRILLIGSIQTMKPNPRLAVYAALKAAGVNLARNLARQLGPEGITVNVLSPGAIATDRNAAVLADPAYRAKVEAQIPAGRIGEPEDCVGAALLLCSDAGRYINGSELFVDGGWHAA